MDFSQISFTFLSVRFLIKNYCAVDKIDFEEFQGERGNLKRKTLLDIQERLVIE